MIQTDAPLFGRVLTAMVTPFGEDLKIDLNAAERMVEHLVSTGTDSIVVAGTTGESPTLEDSEKKELLRVVVSHARGRARVIMGTGNNSTKKTLKSCEEAENLRADGLLVVAPYYNKPSQEGLLAHYEAVASSTKLPIIIYNIPGRTGVNVGVDLTVELSMRFPNIHAIKDSTGGVDQSAEIASRARPDFCIYSGDDYLTLPFLSIGACGVVSVASHLIGQEIKEMIAAFLRGEHDAARRLHYRYLPLFKGLFAAPNPTCVKYALSLEGRIKPNLRLPLVPLRPEQRKTLESVLENLKLEQRMPASVANKQV